MKPIEMFPVLADDLREVDRVIRARLRSEVALINTVSEYIIGAGGKRMRPVLLLLMVNVILLVVGMVLESIAAILILAPIFTPALMAAGVDPIQLGVVVVLNLMIGLLTPPVGMSLYMVSIMAKLPLQRVVAGAIPFLIPLVLALLVVTLVPGVSTWLPNLLVK